MPFSRHDRFSNNVGKIGADGEIPVQAHSPQRRARDETAANSKKSTQDPDHKPYHHQVDRADVRARDWEKHRLF